MNLPSCAIGTTQNAMSSLEALGLPLPKAEAPDYTTYIENGEGDMVGQGWIIARWRFADLSIAQVAVLEAFAGSCYIRTLKADGTYGTYSAFMVLPARRAPKVDLWLDYAAEFRKCVAV